MPDKTQNPGSNPADSSESEVAPAWTSGHKAILEINVSLHTEADADSEMVKTFLKAVGDLAKTKASKPEKSD